MTKEEIKNLLSGNKPTQGLNEKISFKKCGMANEEQSKYLVDAAFSKDRQGGFRRLSHFIGENIDVPDIAEVLKSNTILIGEAVFFVDSRLILEGIAFAKNGYICFNISVSGNGISFGHCADERFEITPWANGFSQSALVEVISNRKEKLKENFRKMKVIPFMARSNEELADAVFAAWEVQA